MSCWDAEDGRNIQPRNNQAISYPAAAIVPIDENGPDHHHGNGNNHRPHCCVSIISILLLSAFAVGVGVAVWACISVDDPPTLYIDSFSVSPLNITNSQISTSWTLGIVLTNPNKRTHIIYDGFQVSLYCEDVQDPCSTSVVPFNQGPKNTTMLVAESKVCLRDLSDRLFVGVTDSSKGLPAGGGGGVADFNVDMSVRYRFVNPLWPGKNWQHMDVDCSTVRVMFDSKSTRSNLLGSMDCFLYLY